MLAFHGNPEEKAALELQVLSHYQADEIKHGVYWENGKGCAVGCIIHGRDHSEFERRHNIPTILARLLDGIFEDLTNGESKELPLNFVRAIPVGADLSMVWLRFAVWLLADAEHGVINFAKTDKQRAAIQRVADLYSRVVAGESVDRREFCADAAAAADDDAKTARASARRVQAAKLLELLTTAPVSVPGEPRPAAAYGRG